MLSAGWLYHVWQCGGGGSGGDVREEEADI